MATAPAFAATPRAAVGRIDTANTNRDGTGTIATVLTAGASGTKIEEITVDFIVTTTAGLVRLFLNDGTNTRLFEEIAVSAITVSATVAAFRAVRQYGDLYLPSGWSLRASTEKAEAANVFVFGGDF